MKMLLLRLLVLAGLVETGVPGWAQTNAPSVSGPRIAFGATEFDFGKVDSGAVVEHVYVFTNTGDQTLEIKDVRPSCGCTTAGDWDKTVAPGQTGKIPVRFNSGGYGGIIHKSVSVTSNDSTKPEVTLQLQGDVWRAFDVTPTYAVFNLMPERQTIDSQTVKIVSNNDQPVTVSDPTCSNPAFTGEVKTVKEGKEFELRVTVNSSNVTGSVSAPITLKTSSTNMPVISVTAFAMMQPLLAVNPPQVNLPEGPLPKPLQYVVTIQNNGTNPIVLSDPAINSDDAKIQLNERQTGYQFNVVLSFPQDFENKPGHNLDATVKSTDPKRPVITIPVIQPVKTTPVPLSAPAEHGGASAAGSAPGGIVSAK